MNPEADLELIASRHEVQRRFGLCLLRLQAYEMLMKAVVAAHDISARAADLETMQADRVANFHGKTLGTVAGELLGSFVVGPESQGARPDRDDAPSVSYRAQIILSGGDFEKAESDMRDLVKLRNDLVHHFLRQHDLATHESCLKAQAALALALDRITQALGVLRSWADDLKEMQGQMAAALMSSEVQDYIVGGRIPWNLTQIAQALHEAAQETGIDGWAPVAAAVRWVNARHPDEQPENYGCTSWRQVIHQSRLFDLRYLMSGGLRQACYRTRPAS